LTLTFTDTDENILYFEKMENGTLTKKFNLYSLENGKYYITTSDASRLVVYTVSIAVKNVNIIEKKETLKPHFRKTKEKIFVNFLNLDKSKVDIKVYDEQYRVVFSETVTEEMTIEKAFNFQGAYAGNYRVVILDAKKSYSENFIVD
jgi:flagellar hook assembly protein FlgD